ncbi:MAG: PIN domain-containing protein [Egibacteraceae bacterium]
MLDASALLAWFDNEPDADAVEAAFVDSVVSTVTLGEVFRISPGLQPDETASRLRALGVDIRPLDVTLAWHQAQVPNQVDYRRDDGVTRKHRLGWGDRVVAALALLEGVSVLTSDRTLAALGDPYRFELFR